MNTWVRQNMLQAASMHYLHHTFHKDTRNGLNLYQGLYDCPNLLTRGECASVQRTVHMKRTAGAQK